MSVSNLLRQSDATGFADFTDHTWASISNASIRRTSQEVFRGGSALLFTSTASTSAIRSNSPTDEYKAIVTSGEEYRALLWFKHGTVGRQIRFGIEYWDASGDVLSSTKSISHIAQGDGSPSTTIVVTTVSPHELSDGDMVSISGTGVSGLNVTNAVVAVTSPTEFQIQTSAALLGPATIGTVTIPGFRSSLFSMGYEGWTLASRLSTAPSGALFACLRIEMVDINTASTIDPLLYIDSPAIVPTTYESDVFMARFGTRVPDYIKRLDDEQTNPNNPLFRYVDLVGWQGQEVVDYLRDFAYVNPADGGELGDTSSLVDPSNYPDSATRPEWLYWMAQHFGVKAATVPGGYTSWSSLAGFTTWNAWEDDIVAGSPPSPVAVATKVRSSGIVTMTTSSSHGFQVGDSLEVATSPRSTFDGIYGVTGLVSSTSFTYSQVKSILSISRSGTTVSVTTGPAHYYQVGDSVVIAGTGNTALNGTFTVASVTSPGADDLPNVFTYTTGSSGTIASIYNTGTTYPANASSTGGTVGLTSDLYWAGAEQYSPYPIEPESALAYLIRTGATGVWAGTAEGIRIAARLPLSGSDLPATIVTVGGVGTVTTKEPHEFSVGETIEIYGTHEELLDKRYTVASVPSSTTFTVAVGPKNLSLSGWTTNKIVNVERGYWTAPPSTLVATGTTITITFTRKIPFTTTSAPVVVAGTSSFNGTYNPASITVSGDRYSISFANTKAAVSETPSGAAVRLTGNQFTYIVKTLPAQTTSINAVVAFAEQAKPAGGVLSHEYI